MTRDRRLTIAVPRGALFDGALDLLDSLGVDTGEVRSNERKLLFEEAGIVTMRPSAEPIGSPPARAATTIRQRPKPRSSSS